MIDRLHARGIGVIIDWVPAHFPRDDFALARFDGTALYEHEDPRRGAHPDWGTLIFNYGRNEVRNFLVASALWLREYHADGLRVDAVASMLYRDYSRAAGEWVPNEYGGREDLDAIGFLRQLNEITHAREPGTIMAAEESTAWPAVSRPPTSAAWVRPQVEHGLDARHARVLRPRPDPPPLPPRRAHLQPRLRLHRAVRAAVPRRGRARRGSLLVADARRRLAEARQPARALRLHVGPPRKKLIFMGAELAQEQEWSHERSLDWHLLDAPATPARNLVRDLNRLYRETPPSGSSTQRAGGFRWLVVDDRDANVVAFARFAATAAPWSPPPTCRRSPRNCTACRCRGRPLARGAEHRRRAWRRQRGQLGGVWARPSGARAARPR